ncbi:MAG: histidine kinase, partial [Planctomycetia bacterium]|nr:histidine kinase [Planctomycetia bacterium]
IESGAEVFDFQTVPLPPLIADCIERHRARAEAKQQVLEAVDSEQWGAHGEPRTTSNGQTASEQRTSNRRLPLAAPSTLPTAWADEEAVSQILDNLVDNAVKYTPPGGRIQVAAHCEDRHVCLEVRDNGIGIPERDLPRIFERFYRVDKARSRELGGTGLGLSIVKHLVQAMNGTIAASSQLHQGTTFTVRLPRAAESW